MAPNKTVSYFADSPAGNPQENNNRPQQILDSIMLSHYFNDGNRASKRQIEGSAEEVNGSKKQRLEETDPISVINMYIQNPPCIKISTNEIIDCFENNKLASCEILPQVPQNAPEEIKSSRSSKAQCLSTKKNTCKRKLIRKERQSKIEFIKEKNEKESQCCHILDHIIQTLQNMNAPQQPNVEEFEQEFLDSIWHELSAIQIEDFLNMNNICELIDSPDEIYPACDFFPSETVSNDHPHLFFGIQETNNVT